MHDSSTFSRSRQMVVNRSAYDVSRWFPATRYYQNHDERLTWAFSALPRLPDGFSCLCLGSWGAEVPFLKGALGAGEVVCIRAPDNGVLPFEECRIEGPADRKLYPATIYALDLEKDELPKELSDFDLVLCWELLEHLKEDPPLVVWQAANALKPGGYLSITTPNALWHYYTTAQLFGQNPLGVKLQPHRPFATHWRLYSPAEITELCEAMGCEALAATSFLRTEPFSLKSRLYLALLGRLRNGSGNGACSYGQFVYVLSRKVRTTEVYRPEWLFPKTRDAGGRPVKHDAVGQRGKSLCGAPGEP